MIPLEVDVRNLISSLDKFNKESVDIAARRGQVVDRLRHGKMSKNECDAEIQEIDRSAATAKSLEQAMSLLDGALNNCQSAIQKFISHGKKDRDLISSLAASGKSSGLTLTLTTPFVKDLHNAIEIADQKFTQFEAEFSKFSESLQKDPNIKNLIPKFNVVLGQLYDVDRAFKVIPDNFKNLSGTIAHV